MSSDLISLLTSTMSFFIGTNFPFFFFLKLLSFSFSILDILLIESACVSFKVDVSFFFFFFFFFLFFSSLLLLLLSVTNKFASFFLSFSFPFSPVPFSSYK